MYPLFFFLKFVTLQNLPRYKIYIFSYPLILIQEIMAFIDLFFTFQIIFKN